jgi:hypothetical protein
MKKSMLVVLVVLLLALLSLPGNVQADPVDIRAFVLSNELGSELEGGLIDQLIAAGHGSDNLYQVLQFLAAQPGSGIPEDFVTEVGKSAPGSEVFTETLSMIRPAWGPFCIHADGQVSIQPIYGRDYEGHTGYATNTVDYSGIGSAKVTMATLPIYYIPAGQWEYAGEIPIYYKAIGIAWAPTVQGVPEPSSILLLTIGLACLAGNARRSRK